MKTIPLTVCHPRRSNLRTHGLVAIVDDEDYEMAMQYRWHATKPGRNCKTWYAKSGRHLLHRLVMNAHHSDGREVDHRNRNGLDCQKSNLRFATSSQNKINVLPRGKSGLKGVRFKSGKWEVSIRPAGRPKRYLGRYSTAEEAARVYDHAALAIHGEFALLNSDLIPLMIDKREKEKPDENNYRS